MKEADIGIDIESSQCFKSLVLLCRTTRNKGVVIHWLVLGGGGVWGRGGRIQGLQDEGKACM